MEHEYLMGVKRYFGGEDTFIVTAGSKPEARDKAEKEIILTNYGNLDRNSLRVIKKIRKTKQNR